MLDGDVIFLIAVMYSVWRMPSIEIIYCSGQFVKTRLSRCIYEIILFIGFYVVNFDLNVIVLIGPPPAGTAVVSVLSFVVERFGFLDDRSRRFGVETIIACILWLLFAYIRMRRKRAFGDSNGFQAVTRSGYYRVLGTNTITTYYYYYLFCSHNAKVRRVPSESYYKRALV